VRPGVFDSLGFAPYTVRAKDKRSAAHSPRKEGSALEQTDPLSPAIMAILKERLGNQIAQYTFPPPVFAAMQGQFVAFDLEAGTLTARFPVLAHYLNPYGTMQGGMIAAAVDNTLGPLSVLVAPPNVTRRLEMTYGQPVTPEMGRVVVTAQLLTRQDRWLHFKAEVRSPGGQRLARAKATHWIVDAG
jgi:acyl-coenzyme A thioesterase PaaI-like protein